MNPACRPLCTMREALADPAIFAEILPGETWAPWRAILIASRGEPLTDDERAIFTALTGREREPERPVDELWGIVGRRGGKSRAFSVLGAYLAGLVDYSAVQAPGERIKLPIMASTTVQAAKIFSYMLGVFEHSAELRDMVDGDPTSETIRLLSGVDIEVRPANYKTIRGETLAGCLADEVAFWHLENSANPDTLILDAVRPGLATTGGPLCVLSSPYARKGELYRTHQRDFGPSGDPAVLVLRAPSQTMNPSLDPAVVKRAYTRDPAAASAEYGAEFRADVEAFISLEAVQACMAGDLLERAPAPGLTYQAFCDPSGGGADSMTLAIGHAENGIAYLDAVREMYPGGSPEAVVSTFAELLQSYGLGSVTGDHYAGEWPKERFRVHGITYERSERSKSDIYREFLPVLNSQRCRMLPVAKLEAQLVSLERRTTRGTGKDTIDHPQVKGAHDDVANAVAGVLVLLASKPSILDLYARLAG
ncbi:hypothetical protein [Methylobacterium radiotolerans]|uniref:Terminase n=1 Tax=Methylobacterium radiotolerans (strain ATCC 27329 / DSM 1819 / JCM 2831 / NBRC 15690 / NCIMB 10815 / 0-1) TaxID=426355 RepID=B1LUG7_METRJ|nr:hypothetical protein [Methylobacterium radiotolerans]ACB23985.1 conserved hypothetical protein [Methylobacterium radiotolerans JCM 2831]GEM97445.1 hypothetical protein MRA01_19850 [Methylobacterium radiotolerans]